jgi:phage protein
MYDKQIICLFILLGITVTLGFINQVFLIGALILSGIIFSIYIKKIHILNNTFDEAQKTKALILENAKVQEQIILENAKIQADDIVRKAKDDLQILIEKIQQAKLDSAAADTIIKDTAELRRQYSEASIDLRKLLYKIRYSKERLNITSKVLKKYYNIWIAEQIPKEINVEVDSKEYYGHIHLNLEEFIREKLKKVVGTNIDKTIRESNNFEKDILNLEKELQNIDPVVTLPLHSLEQEDLKSLLAENYKGINKCYNRFKKSYMTKQNQVIYNLITLALKEGFQNIVYSLKYSNYDISLKKLKQLILKFDGVAKLGNQTVYLSINKFLSEVGLLFENALDIEYQYYVKKEQIKAEQFELRQQMKQEREEAKLLRRQQEALLREESKYLQEIESVKKQIALSMEQEMIKMLENKVKELEVQLSEVKDKKEQILTLQNGKAGYVYVISNIGSFGDGVFKIGMTRRLEPQERIDELSGASVPFRFDVHAFVFSDDAVALESALHKALEANRVNKINRRKEFFYSDIAKLKELVLKFQPTACFIETMLAEQYRMSLRLSQTNAIEKNNQP